MVNVRFPIEIDGLLTGSDGLLQLPLAGQGGAEVVVSGGEFWADFDGKGTRVVPKLTDAQSEDILDPFAGFLHVDRPGKPSLTLDFIEEFRPVVVDRTIFGLANKNVSFEFDEHNMLTKETRRTLAEKIKMVPDGTPTNAT